MAGQNEQSERVRERLANAPGPWTTPTNHTVAPKRLNMTHDEHLWNY